MTHIAVLGSTNMDLVAYVAKAPQRGETVTGREFRTIPGGKGANQAVAAAHAGSDVSMIGAVGADAFGSQLRTTLEHSGVDTDHLRTTEGPSGTAHIVVDDEGGNEIVVIPGANGTVDHLAPGDEALIAGADALLLQLEIPLAAVLAGAEAARRHGVRTILTPSPVQSLPPELLASIDLLVPNEHEAAALTGLTDPRDAATALLDQVPEVVVTLGAAGSLYASRGAEPFTVPAPRVTAVDSTGAGDTFVGTLAVALAEGRPMRAALTWASTAASMSVQRPGASSSMPYRSEIDAQAASNTRHTS
ncbi:MULTISPECIES: ribokinase [Streptomyces]|uniref:Ribokinase n=1 Tax=Streptomyces mirabilis TaxID=68239 RepID=A0ABU3UVW0_9ACTN|nr:MULTISPECIES: ribokinase [Streptomyces]MCX4608060.1 ribokinase [Streptomyces mirabilis]MCX5348525.1 ribokinase [Streptomyces mirabilis]MDU8998074.1 ribokinase [Streptomyces mirabilis]QDN87110.1 ribokinase [Streptomyces sp. RLB3-6]QDO07923.1 ribokinase [Streptomyces sp. S1D4-23]